jgi:hypothetical protein
MAKAGKPLLELFITYSWSFLTILALFTATVALDPFDRISRPDTCDINEPLFTCDNVVVNESNGRLDLVMENNDLESTVVKNIRVEAMNDDNMTQACAQSNRIVQSDSSIRVRCTDLPVQTGQNTIQLSYHVYDARQGPEVGREGNILIRETPGLEPTKKRTRQTPR